MKTYYNEFDEKKCAMLYQLMQDGHITKGDIDDRPIQSVKPSDLEGYERCHFFAGIGLWDHALNLAGWKEGHPVWTGSSPCQPFSAAGGQKGKADDRHLWPEWFRLIKECRPTVLYGEQVASAIAFGWLDDVYQGLEAENYAVGSTVLPACSIGAPHKRDRLWFVAKSSSAQCETRVEVRRILPSLSKDGTKRNNFGGRGETRNTSTVANANNEQQRSASAHQKRVADVDGASKSTVANLHSAGLQEARPEQQTAGLARNSEECGNTERRWENGQWINCPDGKQRLVESTIPLLAHGYPERVAIIHAAGDAIVPQVAAQFIQSTI